MTKSRHKIRKKHVWTSAELELVRSNYPDRPARELAERIGIGMHQLYHQARMLGLKKSQAFKDGPLACPMLRSGDNPGKAYRYPKGHVPANKGTRRPGWSAGRMQETQFKKGRPAHEAHNYVPIGTTKIDPKRNVLMRKVTDDPALFPVSRWRPVHVLVWEAVNGPVPARHMCIFRPGMKTFVAAEITPARLEVVSYEQNMKRNTVHNLPAPLPELILTRALLVRKINRRLRDEEQNGGSAQPSVRSARRIGRQRKPDGARSRGSHQ